MLIHDEVPPKTKENVIDKLLKGNSKWPTDENERSTLRMEKIRECLTMFVFVLSGYPCAAPDDIDDSLRDARGYFQEAIDEGNTRFCALGKFFMVVFPDFTIEVSDDSVQEIYAVPASDRLGLRHVLKVILRVHGENGSTPKDAHTLWCSKGTSADELDLFFHRVHAFSSMQFVVVGVDQLQLASRDTLAKWQEKLHTSGCHGNVLYLFQDYAAEATKTYLKVPRQTFDEEDIEELWDDLGGDLNQLTFRMGMDIKVITGRASGGKTHFIRDEIRKLAQGDGRSIPTTISINDSVDVGAIISTLAMLVSQDRTDGVDVARAIHFNVSVHAPKADVNRLFYQLLVCGVVRDVEQGAVFAIPRGVKWHIYIEVPHSTEWRAQLSTQGQTTLVNAEDATQHFLPLVADVVCPDDICCIDSDSKEYTIVPSVEMCFVAKYIKAFYSEGQVMTGRGELVTIPKNIDRLLTREEAEEWPPKLPFDPCADGNEVLQYFEMLMGDDTLVQQGVLSFSRKQQFDFFVNLLFRRFQAFETTQFIIRQKDSTEQRVTFWGSTLFTQFVKEAVIMCTENFEFALDSWRSKNYSFLIREADPCAMGFTLLYPPPTYADEDTFEACCRGTRIAEIVRGDEEEMKRLTQKEALIKKLSRALGLNSDVVNDVISKRQFVLTPEIVLKLILIHERKLARCAMIIEGETGVGKTFPLEVYSDLINEAAKQDRQRDDSPAVASKVCNWIKNNVFEEGGACHFDWGDDDAVLREDIKLKVEVGCSDKDTEKLMQLWSDILSKNSLPAEHFHQWVRTLPEKIPLLRPSPLLTSLLDAEYDEERGTSSVPDHSGLMAHAQALQSTTLLGPFALVGGDEDGEDHAVSNSKELLHELLCTPTNTLFHRMMIHPGVSGSDVVSFMQTVTTRAGKLEERVSKDALEQIVFFDEMNTGGCIGLLKEILVDRTVNGRPIPDSVFVVAAINPKVELPDEQSSVHDVELWLKDGKHIAPEQIEQLRSKGVDGSTLRSRGFASLLNDAGVGEPEASKLLDIITRDPNAISSAFDDANAPEIARHFYNVNRLPSVLKSLRVRFAVMGSNACSAYVKDRLDLYAAAAYAEFLSFGGQEVTFREDMKEKFVGYIVAAQSFFTDSDGIRNSDGELQFGPSSVSQREITRLFKLMPFFWKIDSEENRRDRQNETLTKTVLLSIALVYYFRLPVVGSAGGRSLRRCFSDHLHINGDFEAKVKEYLDDFVSRDHFVIPEAIALNQALKENVFAVVVCTQTEVPIGIIGSPGSSKTLAYHIARDNLLGKVNSPTEFCKQFDKIDTFFYQCSRYSTSTDIEGVFRNAVQRQTYYDEQQAQSTKAGQRTRCIVFLDEAGLPPESRNVLKVLHAPLDERRVGFVCISNLMFDAANANRMVKVFRSKATVEDLVILACGCAGISNEEQTATPKTTLMHTVEGICQGYLEMLEDVNFKKMFHYRDLIYLFRQLNRESMTATDGHLATIEPLQLLRALEENFNGVLNTEFERLVEIFFRNIQEVYKANIPIPFETPPIDCFRDTIEILRDSVSNGVPVGHAMAPRFKLIIDPMEGDAFPILYDCGIVKEKSTSAFRMSSLPGDKDDPIHAASTLSEITLSMETAGCNILVNTSQIDDSLYDLYNGSFRPGSSQQASDGTTTREMYANIAIGNRTHPKLVNAAADFIVILKAKDLAKTPAPFLSRFNKFLLSAKIFFKLRVQAMETKDEKVNVLAAYERVLAFVRYMRPSSFYGLLGHEGYGGSSAEQSEHDVRSSSPSCTAEEVPLSTKDEDDTANAVAELFLAHIATCKDAGDGKERAQFLPYTTYTSSVRTNRDPQEGADQAQAVEVIVKAMCTRLLQICPPEFLLLKLPKLGLNPLFYSDAYFKLFEHFDLRRLAEKICASENLHVAGGQQQQQVLPCQARKNVIFSRSSMPLQKSLNDLRCDAEYTVVDYRDFERKDSVEEMLIAFTLSEATKLVIQISTRRAADVATIVYMVDQMDLNEKFVFLLITFQAERIYEPRYPALFVHGWDSHFLDQSGGSGHLIVQELAKSTVAAHDDGSSRLMHAVHGDLPTTTLERLESIVRMFCENLHVSLSPTARSTKRSPLSAVKEANGFYISAANGNSESGSSEKFECLYAVLQNHPGIAEIITEKFTTMFNTKRLFQLLHRLAESVASLQNERGFADLVDSHCSSLMECFFALYLEEIVSCDGVVTLAWMTEEDAAVVAVDTVNATRGATFEALLELVELPTLGDIGFINANRSNRRRPRAGLFGFVPKSFLFHLLSTIVQEHLVGISSEDSTAAQVEKLHAKLGADKRLHKVLAMRSDSTFWQSYSFDLAALSCASRAVAGDNGDEQLALNFVADYLCLGASEHDVLAHLHIAARNTSQLQFMYNGYFALNSIGQIPKLTAPTATGFYKAFVTELFQRLWVCLRELSEHEDALSDEQVRTLQAWEKGFKFVSEFCSPSTVRAGREARELKLDVMSMMHVGLSTFKVDADATAAFSAVAPLLSLVSNDRTTKKYTLSALLGILEGIQATPTTNQEQMKVFCNTILVWYVCTERPCSLLTDESNVETLLRILNDEHAIKFEQHTSSNLFAHAVKINASRPAIVVDKINEILLEPHAGSWQSNTLYFPHGHSGRESGGQLQVFASAPIADVYYDWCCKNDQINNFGDNVGLLRQYKDRLDDTINSMHRQSPRSPTDNVLHAAAERRFLEVLADVVKTHARIRDVSDDVFSNPALQDTYTWCFNECCPLSEESNRTHLLAQLYRAMPRRSDVGVLFMKHGSNFGGTPSGDWSNKVAMAFAMQGMGDRVVSTDRLSFMRSIEPASEFDKFPGLHRPYFHFAALFKMAIETKAMDQLNAHLKSEMSNGQSIDGLQPASVYKMFIVLTVFHDFWGDGQSEELRGCADTLWAALTADDAGLLWEPHEKTALSLFLRPEQTMVGWGTGGHNIASVFESLSATAGDNSVVFAARSIMVNQLALMIGLGADRGGVLRTMNFHPEQMDGSFVLGGNHYRYAINRGVNFDCMTQFHSDGRPVGTSWLPVNGMHFWGIAHFGAIAMHTLSNSEAATHLVGPILSSGYVDIPEYGDSRHDRLGNFCRERIQFSMLQFARSTSASSQEHATLSINQMLETYVHAVVGNGSAVFPATIADDAALSDVEATFKRHVLTPHRNEQHSHQQAFERIRSSSQVDQSLGGIVASLNALNFTTGQPFPITMTTLQDSLTMVDSDSFKVLRCFVGNASKLGMLSRTALPIARLYQLIHSKLSHRTPLTDQNKLMATLVNEYAATLNSVSQQHVRKVETILNEGIEAFNAYHAERNGMLGPVLCASGGGNSFSALSADIGSLKYVVTTVESMIPGTLEELHDILWLVLDDIVKVQNDLLGIASSELQLDFEEAPLGNDAGGGIVRVQTEELLTLVNAFATVKLHSADSGEPQEARVEFDFSNLETAIVQRYLTTAVEIVPEHYPFKFKVRKVDDAALHSAFFSGNIEVEQLADLPDRFKAQLSAELTQQVSHICADSEKDSDLTHGEHITNAYKIVEVLSRVSQDFVEAAGTEGGKRQTTAGTTDASLSLHEYLKDKFGRGYEALPKCLDLIAKCRGIEIQHISHLHQLCSDRLDRSDYLLAHLPTTLAEDLPVGVPGKITERLSAIPLAQLHRAEVESLAQESAGAMVVLDLMLDEVRIAPDRPLSQIYTSFVKRSGDSARLKNENRVLKAVGVTEEFDDAVDARNGIKGVHLAKITSSVLMFARKVRTSLVQLDRREAMDSDKEGWVEVDADDASGIDQRFVHWLQDAPGSAVEIGAVDSGVGAKISPSDSAVDVDQAEVETPQEAPDVALTEDVEQVVDLFANVINITADAQAVVLSDDEDDEDGEDGEGGGDVEDGGGGGGAAGAAAAAELGLPNDADASFENEISITNNNAAALEGGDTLEVYAEHGKHSEQPKERIPRVLPPTPHKVALGTSLVVQGVPAHMGDVESRPAAAGGGGAAGAGAGVKGWAELSYDERAALRKMKRAGRDGVNMLDGAGSDGDPIALSSTGVLPASAAAAVAVGDAGDVVRNETNVAAVEEQTWNELGSAGAYGPVTAQAIFKRKSSVQLKYTIHPPKGSPEEAQDVKGKYPKLLAKGCKLFQLNEADCEFTEEAGCRLQPGEVCGHAAPFNELFLSLKSNMARFRVCKSTVLLAEASPVASDGSKSVSDASRTTNAKREPSAAAADHFESAFDVTSTSWGSLAAVAWRELGMAGTHANMCLVTDSGVLLESDCPPTHRPRSVSGAALQPEADVEANVVRFSDRTQLLKIVFHDGSKVQTLCAEASCLLKDVVAHFKMHCSKNIAAAPHAYYQGDGSGDLFDATPLDQSGIQLAAFCGGGHDSCSHIFTGTTISVSLLGNDPQALVLPLHAAWSAVHLRACKLKFPDADAIADPEQWSLETEAGLELHPNLSGGGCDAEESEALLANSYADIRQLNLKKRDGDVDVAEDAIDLVVNHPTAGQITVQVPCTSSFEHAREIVCARLQLQPDVHAFVDDDGDVVYPDPDAEDDDEEEDYAEDGGGRGQLEAHLIGNDITELAIRQQFDSEV